MSDEVYVVQHLHEFDDGSEDVKFIGVYSSQAGAEAAVERLRTQAGFVDTPHGFHIDRYELDRDHWAEGYSTYRYPAEPVSAADSQPE
jgi:hypothetical protein